MSQGEGDGMAEGEGAGIVDEPLFNPLQVEEHLNIEDESDYRKAVYAADFVDFENDFCKTPRFIRPHTESQKESRPGTSVSWVSSNLSEEGGEEEVERPLDTWVDEPRLLNAFEKIREKVGGEERSEERSDDLKVLSLCFLVMSSLGSIRPSLQPSYQPTN